MLGIFERLMRGAKKVMESVTDPRKQSNATKYEMAGAGMGALWVFTTQSPSFLNHQERLARGKAHHNFNTLFGCPATPTPEQIRNILDGCEHEQFYGLYDNALEVLEKEGGLEQFQALGGVLIAADGTQSYSSSKIHCSQCSTKTHANGTTTYHHSVLCTSIVKSGVNEAIPLIPEFILPQDGHDKQDCEIAAIKRWASEHQHRYGHLNPTILGDDLFAKQTVCQALLDVGYNFIFTCKPESHQTLHGYLNLFAPETHTGSAKKGYKEYHYQYKFLNAVPIKNSKDALLVNCVEITETSKKTGKITYKNTFVTNHQINRDNVAAIASSGRARWHIENDNNNTLKTRGYRFEHNYGHGKRNLSVVLTSFAIVAFLYHTTMGLVDKLYIVARKANGSRLNFFNELRAYTNILVFASWENLMRFMIDPPDLSKELGVL